MIKPTRMRLIYAKIANWTVRQVRRLLHVFKNFPIRTPYTQAVSKLENTVHYFSKQASLRPCKSFFTKYWLNRSAYMNKRPNRVSAFNIGYITARRNTSQAAPFIIEYTNRA